ncbi:MAG: thiamine-phosphate kinase, partial [Candidatus Heimdallarchaeaceae archaeon]
DILFLGGDLNETEDIIVDLFSFGICKKDKVLPRKGAQDGDVLYSTGLFGLTSLAFQIIMKNLSVSSDLQEQSLNSVYEPKARKDALEIFEEIQIKVCMDSSDGLLVTLNELSRINEMGIEINNVPIHLEVLKFAEERKLNPLDLAFKGGEEFELIFAVESEIESIIEEKSEELGLEIIKIGSFRKNINGIKVNDPRLIEYELPKKGYEHFQK